MSTQEGHFHAVRFYEDPDSLCRIVGEFIGSGLEQGEPAVVIATPAHTAAIDECLRARGLDVDALKRLGDYTTVDAREALGMFMDDALPNSRAFRHNMGETIRLASRGRDYVTVRAYGEMVDLLWKDGLEAAAIRLETLWNELANAHGFKLLCGYSMGNFYKGAAIEDIKAQHSHLVADIGQTVPVQSRLRDQGRTAAADAAAAQVQR
jgi:MEDS: MEthanogen/methylotroph, DcmR Sensory domain